MRDLARLEWRRQWAWYARALALRLFHTHPG